MTPGATCDINGDDQPDPVMPMTPERFSTDGLPPRLQLDAWRGWFETVFEVEVEDEAQVGFVAESKFWSLGGFGLGRVAAPTLRSSRSKTLIRRNPIDHWVLTIGQTRTGGLSASDTTLDIPARVPFLVSLGTELVSDRKQDERLHLYLPRDTFSDLAPVLDAAQGRALDTPVGRMLGDFMVLLEQSLPSLTVADLTSLTPAVRAMVLAGAAPSAERARAARGQIAFTRKEKVRQIIIANLRNPGLDPDMLCRQAGMSRTSLYRLLDSQGGIARCIQRERLRAAHGEIADPAGSRPITAIAAALGFEDPSSFSRAFKQEFGFTPREARADAGSGFAALAGRVPREVDGARDLRDCLRDFR